MTSYTVPIVFPVTLNSDRYVSIVKVFSSLLQGIPDPKWVLDKCTDSSTLTGICDSVETLVRVYQSLHVLLRFRCVVGVGSVHRNPGDSLKPIYVTGIKLNSQRTDVYSSKSSVNNLIERSFVFFKETLQTFS